MSNAVTAELAGRPLKIEIGSLANQSDAGVVVTYGDTIVLATANVTDKPVDLPFMPLRVDFEEKMYSVGRIPGGFFKREGRPSEEATLTCRKIDRPIRPLIPSGMRNDMQIIVLPLSVECDSAVDVTSMIAGAAAMHLSSIPFEGPFGTVRVAQIDGELRLNPPFEAVEEGQMDLLVAATREGIVQIEMDGAEVSEQVVLEGLKMGYEACMPLIDLMEDLRAKAGNPKRDFPLWQPRDEVVELVTSEYQDQIAEALSITDRVERDNSLSRLEDEVAERLVSEQELANPAPDVEAVFEDVVKARLQDLAFDHNKRVDGRALDEVRPVSCQVGMLPRVHGAGLFQRGETQVLSITTLGAYTDQRLVRTLEEEEYTRFMHHYNFPPFSTGEVRGLRGASRRDIGHGEIGKKAIERLLPAEDDFPYTIRLVSEVLAANASTSMAATCACSLALMDAGVPIKTAVGGVALGLIRRGDEYRVLTDMQGVEDFMGYMDFKIAGTAEGITCIQLDTKTHGLPMEVLEEALEKGRLGRLEVLETMNATISEARTELSRFAPTMVTVRIPEEKIGLVIGPGGKNIRALQHDYEVSVDIEDDGTVRIFGEDRENVGKVVAIIRDMTREIEVGEVIKGTVVTITDYGAFVEIMPGRDGLLHISDIAWEHVNKTEDVLNVGDEVEVKVMAVDSDGKVRLSRKDLLERPEGVEDSGPRDRGSRGGRGDRSSRGGSSRGGSKGGSRSSSSDSGPTRDSSENGPSRGKAYFRDKKRGQD